MYHFKQHIPAKKYKCNVESGTIKTDFYDNATTLLF